jgi:hypothetical protein
VFVTMPHFEQFMPRDLVGPNQKYWRAVTLSVETPWYLFIYEAEYEGQKVPQTTLVAWESTLLDSLTGIPERDRRAVARLEKERRPGFRWSMAWIETIWAPAPEEQEETGVLLLQLAGDTQVRDAHLAPVAPREGRVLVFNAASQHPPERAQSEYEPSSVNKMEVPIDFPAAPPTGVVPGAQPKVGATESDGVFQDASRATRAERYDVCQDLVNQLVAYAERKLVEQPGIGRPKLLGQVLAQLQKKRFGWGLSPLEAEWISARVRAHFFGMPE